MLLMLVRVSLVISILVRMLLLVIILVVVILLLVLLLVLLMVRLLIVVCSSIIVEIHGSKKIEKQGLITENTFCVSLIVFFKKKINFLSINKRF